MADINIPPEAVKAAAYKLDPIAWRSYSGQPREIKAAIDHRRTRALEQARAAIRAALEAWPGMRMMVDIDTGDDAAIKLPLPTENPDAEA